LNNVLYPFIPHALTPPSAKCNIFSTEKNKQKGKIDSLNKLGKIMTKKTQKKGVFIAKKKKVATFLRHEKKSRTYKTL